MVIAPVAVVAVVVAVVVAEAVAPAVSAPATPIAAAVTKAPVAVAAVAVTAIAVVIAVREGAEADGETKAIFPAGAVVDRRAIRDCDDRSLDVSGLGDVDRLLDDGGALLDDALRGSIVETSIIERRTIAEAVVGGVAVAQGVAHGVLVFADAGFEFGDVGAGLLEIAGHGVELSLAVAEGIAKGIGGG